MKLLEKQTINGFVLIAGIKILALIRKNVLIAENHEIKILRKIVIDLDITKITFYLR